MNLDEARRAAIDGLLQQRRARLSVDLLRAIALAIVGVALLALELPSPETWAKGDWFRPGSWLHDTLGFDGAVLALRLVTLLWPLSACLWVARILHKLRGGMAVERERIAAEFTLLGGPPRNGR